MLKKMMVAFVASLSSLVAAIRTGIVAISRRYADLYLVTTRARGNIPALNRELRRHWAGASVGAISIDMIIMVFVGIVLIYQLIIQIGSQNAALQASSNVSSTAKWAGGMGEWLFPLLGIFALVMLFFSGKRGGFGRGRRRGR